MVGFWQLFILLVLVLLIFGGTKKFPSIMKDLAKGLRVFKETAIDNKDNSENTSSREKQESEDNKES